MIVEHGVRSETSCVYFTMFLGEEQLSITLNIDNMPCELWVRHSIPVPQEAPVEVQRHLGELGSSGELNITGQSLPSTAGHSTADTCPPKEIMSRVKC